MAPPFFGHLSGGPILGLIAGCPEGDRFETLRTCSALFTLDRLAICSRPEIDGLLANGSARKFFTTGSKTRPESVQGLPCRFSYLCWNLTVIAFYV
jgi:hypothetical protein